MNADILYCGDTTLATAACYLGGLLTHAGWSFDYAPSDQALTGETVQAPRSLYIVSDYPADQIDLELQARVVENVHAGSGLLMIGGWESYQGLGGNWAGTPLGDLLPVEISQTDDRQNCDSPVFLKCHASHPIVDGLPWSTRPPLIGGYNRVRARADGQLLLTAERFSAIQEGETYRLSWQSSDPLLVTASVGEGRVVALMTDLAPHWVGPLVDWGGGRVQAQAPGAESVDVGDLYAQFVRQLICWAGQLENGSPR